MSSLDDGDSTRPTLMVTKKKIATGLGIAALLALGFAASISTGMMAGTIPAALYGQVSDAPGCLTNLGQNAEQWAELSRAQIRSEPMLMDGTSGGYCFNPPKKSGHL
ncbi:hypothetical protein KBJ94_23415 [Pseudomonas sp. ITA]|uniref:hypothetical protein n=1 Tax=Pseudomonas sp. ITA TaxID=2825841 RepID=UPI0024983E84|nr:hypothetical protein [Pseudomonas sp. ITA]MDI2145003.1 hypothetical protein [Pseudomonas sp. ITA]